VCFAHGDHLERAEACYDVLDPLRGWFGQPAAMLAAVGANELTGMRAARRADRADVSAARSLAIDGPIEFHLEAWCAEEVGIHPASFSFAAASKSAAAAAVLNRPRL